MTDPQEQLFIENALSAVGKAERRQRIKQVVVTVFAFAAAFWLASKPSSKELGVECSIIIVLGSALAVCTSKILHLINKNTRTVLQAIGELHNKRGMS